MNHVNVRGKVAIDQTKFRYLKGVDIERCAMGHSVTFGQFLVRPYKEGQHHGKIESGLKDSDIYFERILKGYQMSGHFQNKTN